MIDDIREMIVKYGFDQEKFDAEKLNFRILGLLTEEYEEILLALHEKNAEELVDGLIDLIVIAIGTLELSEVHTRQAWDEVMKANMQKKRGIKSTRPNSNGFDLIKLPDWVPPDHTDNVGVLAKLFGEKK